MVVHNRKDLRSTSHFSISLANPQFNDSNINVKHKTKIKYIHCAQRKINIIKKENMLLFTIIWLVIQSVITKQQQYAYAQEEEIINEFNESKY